MPDEIPSSCGLRILSNDRPRSYKEYELCAEIFQMDAGLHDETKEK